MAAISRFFDSKFIGCMIIGQTHDPHRQRNVTLYALHDEPGMVGIYDGIDRWATQASTDPFGMKVSKTLAEIENGALFEIEQGQTMRREHDAPGVHPVPVRTGSKPRRRALMAIGRIFVNGEEVGQPVYIPITDAQGHNYVLKKERRRASL